MIAKYFVPGLALSLAVFAVGYAFYSQSREPDLPPPVTPSISPFGNTVAGEGMVEPSTESSGSAVIPVGTQLAGIVTQIPVHIDEEVKAGQLLFELDRRQTVADLKVREAALHSAEESLRRLELQPRPEEVPVSEAQVLIAEANVRTAQDQVERDKGLIKSGAITPQERYDHVQALDVAQGQLAQSKASLAL